ncbi:MAG: phenylacetate-CoA oxygenase subunit PaaI [Bacteriovoracaceae bacterium]|nr:phenylacetate-CoA oxygenase subunit PaaI [Bacteriovoracaceae bacterium]
MQKYNLDEQKLFEEIKNGKTFGKDDTLPPLFRKKLLNLLWMQGDSEYSGALGYAPWIEKAPTFKEKVIVAQIVKDEMRHASVVFKLLRDLGENPERHVEESKLSYKLEEDEINIGFTRAKSDFRVNIFYYQIKYWEDFVLFNFLMDRAAGHQLEDTLESSYTPWKEAIGGIYKEEIMHIAHGDKWIKKLASDPEKKDFLQERLNLWWPRVMNVFGNSKGRANDIYVRLGLKKRSNAEIREIFRKEILDMAESWGLKIPEYDESLQKN